MKHNIEPRDYWEGHFKDIDAETYDFSKSKPANALIGFCKKYLRADATILDLGCGGGRNAHYLAKHGYRVYGVDISATAVEFCQKRFARFKLSGTFKQGTFDHIPFPDNYFSNVICVAALDHVTLKTAQATIVEIRRVLIPGGRVLLTFDPPGIEDDNLDETDVLPDGTLKFVRGKLKGLLFYRYEDAEIISLIGEENIISFKTSKKGARTIICH